jgi:rfaE bifunctional protein nucleotidyltransferase chain/domain
MTMTASAKIKTINELTPILASLRRKNKRIVLCHGVFDLLHPGHILYFQAAKKHGDTLVVTVTPDEYVNKGPNRPVFNQRLRLESLAALESIDYVALNEWPTAVNTILKFKPHIYAKGQDYANAASDISGQIRNEMAAVKRVGGKTVFTNEQMFSSSHLINRFFNVLPANTQQYLSHFRNRHPAKEVLQYLKRLSALRVLVVGEAILDQYCYCQPLGKAQKDNIVPSKFLSEENFAGGSLAIANHLAGFCGKVSLVAPIGTEPGVQKFFATKLSRNVQFHPIRALERPTITKRRFVESNFLTKMFEIQYLDDSPLPPAAEQETIDILRKLLYKYDVVVVADYGHGFLTDRLRDEVISMAKFLCVNTQTNSANSGYNLATRYKNMHYLAIDEPELRMAMRTKYGDVKEVAMELRRQVHAELLLVSRGPNGSLVLPKDGKVYETPVVSTRIIDRVGAGDAVYAVTSPCVYLGVPPEVIGFIGNCVGAMAVEIVCNRQSISSVALSQFITGVLK